MDIAVVRSLVKTVLEQAPDFDGKAELLGQVHTIEVVGGPLTMLELSVDRSLPAGRPLNGPVPGSCWSWDSDGSPIGVLDIDSETTGRFTEADEREMELAAAVVAAMITKESEE